MIKPWVFQFFNAPADPGVLVPVPRAGVTPSEAAAHFDEYWQAWIRAEEYGLEGIFFSEHHFGPGYSPSPNLLIAALAPVTKTLRMGVMGVVLPYYQPWRVLEEIAMLDHLTKGRLEVGTASGIPPEMETVGISATEASERNMEAQDIIDWALTHPDQPITHHGKYWTLDNLVLAPQPLQQPPPRWTTVVSEASARRAGRRGSKICTGFSSVETVKQVFAGHREEAEKAGLAVDRDWYGLRRGITIAADAGEAAELGARSMEQTAQYAANPIKTSTHGPAPDAPQAAHGGLQIPRDEFIIGDPAQVAEQIIAQCRAIGAGHFLARIEGHGDARDERRAFELFGREVVPLLRRAQI